MTEPASILIFRNGSIGNTLAALPAIHALHVRYPKAKISVVLDSVGAELTRFNEDIDERIVYEKRGTDRGIIAYLKLVHRLRKLHPSHAILFKRFFRNGLLAFLSGAPRRIGFRTESKAPFLNLTTSYDESVHVIDLNLRLVELLDTPSRGRRYSIPISSEDRDTADSVLREHVDEGERFVTAHYGGLTASPDFMPVEYFCELLRILPPSHEKIILIGAGSKERLFAESIASRLPTAIPLLDLNVRLAVEIIKRADYFLGFNSGPAHLAAATDTPGTILYPPASGVEREINKWRPASESMRTMIPPPVRDHKKWRSFVDEFSRIATAQPSGNRE